MSDDDTAEEIIIVDQEDVEYALETAAAHGVEANELTVHGIEPITTATLIIFGSALAVAAVSRLIDQHKGGQVIDLRPQAPRLLYRTKDVLYGLVVIVATDGRVTVEVKEPRTMFGEVLDALKDVIVNLSGSGASDIATAVAAKVGEKANVAVEGQP
jgi:hypothetical protein